TRLRAARPGPGGGRARGRAQEGGGKPTGARPPWAPAPESRPCLPLSRAEMLGDAGERDGRSGQTGPPRGQRGREPGAHGVTPSRPVIPGAAAGGTPPLGGALAEPRTSVPLLAGRG